MQVPEEYEGPKLLTVLRDPKIDPPEYLKFVEIAFGKDAKIKGPVGTFAQEQYNGNFAQNFRKFFEKKHISWITKKVGRNLNKIKIGKGV